MLTKFSVENFKPFRTKFVLDLSNPGNYEFNKNAIRHGVISRGILFGINGIGKSNLGRALFDIVNTLTDQAKELDKYIPFLNLYSKKPYASFEYEFKFGDSILIYRYRKIDVNTLIEESLSINGQEMLYYDFTTRSGSSAFAGSESLNLNDSSFVSRLKFVMNTSVLDESDNRVQILLQFKKFVNGMLLFYSLRENGFVGFRDHGNAIEEIIIKANKVSDFQSFLKDAGVNLSLKGEQTPDGYHIYVIYPSGKVPYFTIASTGMISLILLYSWLISIEECSFVFIDEFDAFYHYELAELIVKRLRDNGTPQVFVSTHNTDLLANELLRPDCYFILDETELKSVKDATDRDLRFAHNLQKMYKAHAFSSLK